MFDIFKKHLARRFVERCNHQYLGNPKCDENNVLVHATVVKGKISMNLLTQTSRLSEWFENKRYTLPKINANITDFNTIKTFLDRVRGFYSSTNMEGTEYRFDYRLTYGPKEDDYDGRELFERYFYPAGLSRVVD